MEAGLTTSAEFLRNAAKQYFDDRLSKPKIEFDAELQSGLDWRPSLVIKANHYTKIAVEVSDDKPYPGIFRLRRAELDELNEPVSVYSVCPEEAYTNDQKDSKQLVEHGFGLITVAADGTPHLVKDCVPLMSRISEKDFKDEIKPLPASIKRRAQEAFGIYQSNPVSGLSNLCELVEGMIIKAAKDSTKKGFISLSQAASDKSAELLDAMIEANDLRHSRAAIGAIRGYISEARNVANHTPKSKKAAFERLRKSKIQFLDGIRNIEQFRTSIRKRGLSGQIIV